MCKSGRTNSWTWYTWDEPSQVFTSMWQNRNLAESSGDVITIRWKLKRKQDTGENLSRTFQVSFWTFCKFVDQFIFVSKSITEDVTPKTRSHRDAYWVNRMIKVQFCGLFLFFFGTYTQATPVCVEQPGKCSSTASATRLSSGPLSKDTWEKGRGRRVFLLVQLWSSTSASVVLLQT